MLNYKNLEKYSVVILLFITFAVALYFFVFKIDWVTIYLEKDGDQKLNLSIQTESCIKCHGEVEGFSPGHNPKHIGCVSCHLGNKLERDKSKAHEGLVLIPGNLSDAKITCGQSNCHPGIAERVDSSLMSTMSGVISVNKYAFEEIDSPSGKFHIKELGYSPSESHLRNLCASCHLGNEKKEFGPIAELSRGGGCNACHLNYSTQAQFELSIYDSLKKVNPDSTLLKFHPSLSLNIKNDHCFGCHSRSGRISTSYEGWHETTLSSQEIGNKENYRQLDDGRIFEMIKPDVHYEAGLVCVDCHISYEVMGDGKFYEHKEEQLLVHCEDCHSLKEKEYMIIDEFDYESGQIAKINKLTDKKRKFIKVKKSGTPLINSKIKNRNEAILIGKQTKKEYKLNPPKFECISSNAHSSLSCNSCHTSWAPQCVGCHTQYESETEGFDLLNNTNTNSAWVEYHGEFFAELPTLGVREIIENGKSKNVIDTFIPGMIMTLDKKKYENSRDKLIFKRLFAPANAHTIQKVSRSCESCHNNPLALGYGRGELEYIIHNKVGRWIFEPKFEKMKYDNLPEDAWIGFMDTRKEDMATRVNVRPFNQNEQKRILTVGTCLECHSEESEIIKTSLISFNELLERISTECILPTWDN